jgi:adenosyl cobinamide kinase/adenosyl cobinamide phosphate guanylyltransferase
MEQSDAMWQARFAEEEKKIREEERKREEKRREEKKAQEKKMERDLSKETRRRLLCDELDCLDFMVKNLGKAEERPWTEEEKNNRRIEIEVELEDLESDI